MTEYRLIMTAITVLCGLGAASTVWPVIDTVMTAVELGLAGLTVAGYATREAVRELRFRRDMRALDARDTAWAAQRAAWTEVPA